MKSTLFFNAFTEIDFADATGDQFLGRSLSVSALVTGEVDSKEKVVGDFSTVKKVMKAAIDGPHGPDHKCVVCIDQKEDRANGLVASPTGTWELSAPRDAFFFLPTRPKSLRDFQVLLSGAMASVVTHAIRDQLGLPCTVEIFLDEVFSLHVSETTHGPRVAYFSYTHGLKDSTSYGCQNIAHGHRSFLQVVPKANVPVGPLESALQRLAIALSGTMFINAENVRERIHHPSSKDATARLSFWTGSGTVGYSCPRGMFSLALNDYPGKVTILETETTVEYLAEYVRSLVQESADYLPLRGNQLFISEGLKKGAVIQL